MSTPFFSIITPTFNRSHLISRCINSVINQTFTDWELIIIDDGSTDNTKEVIKKLSIDDTRIKYFYQQNQKLSSARNAGLEKTCGKYICYLDSDDEYDANHLEILFNFLQSSNFFKRFLYTQFRFKDGDKSDDIRLPEPAKYSKKELSRIM